VFFEVYLKLFWSCNQAVYSVLKYLNMPVAVLLWGEAGFFILLLLVFLSGILSCRQAVLVLLGFYSECLALRQGFQLR